MNRYPMVRDWLADSGYKYDNKQVRIVKESGSPRMQLFEHRQYLCEDDQVQWTEEHQIELIDISEYNAAMIDQYLNSKNFHWMAYYKPKQVITHPEPS